MLSKIRKMMKAEEGFTLIELMVVILIIGILMAIAIPSFIAVRNRGYASSAKANRATAVKTMELYATDNDGSYDGADAAALGALETAITFTDAQVAQDADPADQAWITDAVQDGFIINVIGRDGLWYSATKEANGAVVYADGQAAAAAAAVAAP